MKGHSKAITHLSLLLTVILLGGNDTHAQITPMQGAEGRPSGHPTRQGTQVIEIRQHSIKADPAVNATFPKSWTPAPVAGAPPASPGDSEDAEAEDVGLQLAPIVEEDLSPGASRAVDLQVSSPSVL